MSSGHRGILYVHQIGVTILAPAVVTESLLGHGQAIVTLTAGIPQQSKQAFGTLTLLQTKCSPPASGVGKRTGKHKQGRESMTKKLPGKSGERRILWATWGNRNQERWGLQSKLLTTEIRDKQIKMLLNFFIVEAIKHSFRYTFAPLTL